MEVHKPFVSPSIITGQLASLWFSTTAMGASQGATSDVLSKVTPQEHRLLPRNPFPWSVRVIMMSMPEHHPLFHMSLSWWHRFSWDLNQLSQMRQRRRRGPTKLCRCLIAPYELIPSKCPIFFHGHLLRLPQRSHGQRILLLISAGWTHTFVNEQWKTVQCCNASETVREQMHWTKSTAASHHD